MSLDIAHYDLSVDARALQELKDLPTPRLRALALATLIDLVHGRDVPNDLLLDLPEYAQLSRVRLEGQRRLLFDVPERHARPRFQLVYAYLPQVTPEGRPRVHVVVAGRLPSHGQVRETATGMGYRMLHPQLHTLAESASHAEPVPAHGEPTQAEATPATALEKTPAPASEKGPPQRTEGTRAQAARARSTTGSPASKPKGPDPASATPRKERAPAPGMSRVH